MKIASYFLKNEVVEVYNKINQFRFSLDIQNDQKQDLEIYLCFCVHICIIHKAWE